MTMTPFAKVLDAIPVVPTTAYRNTFYPSTTTINQRVQNLETGNIERWTGTAWVTDFYGVLGPTTGAELLTGTGTPNGAVMGNPGFVYVQRVSTTVDLLWIKQSGTGTNTGWQAISATGTGSPEGVLTAPPGVSFVQTDTTVGQGLWVKQSGTAATGWRPLAGVDQRANAQRFLAKLNRNMQNATLLLLSDSTGGVGYWTPAFWASLAALFPAYTVTTTVWDTTTGAYPAATTIQTGTGAQTLAIYNFSIPGATTSTPLAPAFYSPGGGSFQSAVQVVQPDYVLLSYGHNEGATPATTVLDYWVSQYLELVTTLAQALPDAEMCVIAQNPETANTYQGQRADAYAKIAATYGLGFIDIHQVFQDNGGGALLDIDGVHPNATGSALWALAMAQCYHFSETGQVTGAGFPWPSADEELLTNGDFSNYPVSPGAPTGWVAVGSPTVSKDVTNYESPNGYGVQIQAAGSVNGYLQQSLTTKRFAGKWVTLLARVYVGTGQPGNAGVIGLYDGVVSSSTSRSRLSTFSQGAFRWVTWQLKVDATATTLVVFLNGDAGAQNGVATFDRVSLRIGRWPIVGVANGAVAVNRLQPGTLPDGTYIVGSDTGTNNGLALNGAAGTSRILKWLTAGVLRWLFNLTGTESGSNAGATLIGQAYDDSGALIDNWLQVVRKVGGLITLSRSLMANAFGATLSADNGDAGVTLTWGTSVGIQWWNTPLTATRTVTLIGTSVPSGAGYFLVRTAAATGAFVLNIGTGGAVTTLGIGQWVYVAYDTVGATFRAIAQGNLLDAPLASPALTGTPTAPTATANTNSTQLATTAYVDRTPGSGSFTSAAPAGTTSATAVMMAAGAATITPTKTGRVLMVASGQMANSTLNDGATVDLRSGTGTAPVNGAAVTGTLRGIAQTATSTVAAQRSGFCLSAVVSGLTLGTAVWVDVSLLAVTAGTATVTGVHITVTEV